MQNGWEFFAHLHNPFIFVPEVGQTNLLAPSAPDIKEYIDTTPKTPYYRWNGDFGVK